MIYFDSDALECDMAETYGVLDVSVLPVLTYAKLAAGLRANSRIKLAMSGEKQTTDINLLALIFDRLGHIFGGEGLDSAYDILNSDPVPENQKVSKKGRVLFKSADEFEQELERITKNGR